MLRLRTISLDPVNAEIAIEFPLQEGDELRGKLMGPRCRYASTIEIAYPVRKGKSGYHVLVPEPSAWEPTSPFLYAGKIEHLRQGQKIAEYPVEHGLLRLASSKEGLRLNGKPFDLRPIEVDRPSEEDLLRFREEGFNCLKPESINASLWKLAAQIGFFIQAETVPPERVHHFVTLPS